MLFVFGCSSEALNKRVNFKTVLALCYVYSRVMFLQLVDCDIRFPSRVCKMTLCAQNIIESLALDDERDIIFKLH